MLASLVAIGLLTALTAASASAQEIPDVPDLGLEITPVEGVVGDTVEGAVDTADIAEHCITTPEDFTAQLTGDFADAFNTYFLEVLEGDPGAIGSPERVIGTLFQFVPLVLAQDLDQAEEAMEATFVFAFADLATASPIDPLGNFDRDTGAGSVNVPDLTPGNHPVIASCVEVPSDLTNDDIGRAFAAGQAYLEANFEEPYPDLGSDEFNELGGEVFPVSLQELVQPRALGVEFYCVDDGTGSCDEEPPPNGNGEDPLGNGNGATTPAARPVSGQPTLTG